MNYELGIKGFYIKVTNWGCNRKELEIRNMEDKVVIRKFTDLDAWKEGHILVLGIYKITEVFLKVNSLD